MALPLAAPGILPARMGEPRQAAAAAAHELICLTIPTSVPCVEPMACLVPPFRTPPPNELGDACLRAVADAATADCASPYGSDCPTPGAGA